MAQSAVLELILNLKDNATKNLNQFQGGIDRTKSRIDGIVGSVANVRNALAGLGAGLAIKDVVSTFASFDDTMRAVQAVSGATTEEFAAMRSTAEELGATTRFSAAEAAEGMKLLSMAGFDAAETTKALPGVLDLAAAGAMDLGDAADIASNMLTAYGMSADELGRVNDVMVEAFTSSNSTLTELGEGFKYVAPIAAGVGVELEGLVAPLAKLHDAGIKGSMAGTALRGALDALMNPTVQEAELMAELSSRIGGAGLQIENAEGDFVGFASIIEQLEGSGITASEALKLFGQRAGPGMQALLSQGSGSLRDFEAQLQNSGGRAKQVAADMEAGLGGAIRSMISAWEGLKIALGAGIEQAVVRTVELLTAKLRGAIDTIKRLSADGTLQEWANRIADAIMETVGYLDSMIRAAGALANGPLKPLVTMFINWAPEIIAITVGLGTLSKDLGAASMAMQGVNAAMGMGQWVAYLRHVMTASTYAGTLTVATASLGNAMAVAAAAVAAFFAGWKIGELISASDAFGLLPLKVGEFVQIGFGKIDEFISKAKIKFLELRKLWNEFTGDQAEADAIQKAIEAEKEHITQIHQVVAAIGEKERAAAKAGTVQTAAAKKAAEAETAAVVSTTQAAVQLRQAEAQQAAQIQRQRVDNYLASLKEETEAAKTAYDRRIMEIEIAEARGVLTHNQAVQQKAQAQQIFYQATVGQADQIAQEAAQAYGKDSSQFQQAIQAKKTALDGYLQKELEIANQIKSLNEQVNQSRMSSEDQLRELRRKTMGEYDAYQDKVRQIEEKIAQAQKLSASDTQASIELFKQAQQMANGVSAEVVEGEKVVVSQQKAVGTAMGLVEKAQAGIEQAANEGVKALEGQADANRKASEETKQALNEIEQAVVQMGDQVIYIKADGTVAKEEIATVEAEFEKLEDQDIKIDVDTSGAESKVDTLRRKIDALNKAASKESTKKVKFKGEASPVKPLSETIDDVSAKMKAFDGSIEDQEKKIDFKGNTGDGDVGAMGAFDELGQASEDLKEVAEEPITPRVDISPAKAAYAELASEAHKNAVAAMKAFQKVNQVGKQIGFNLTTDHLLNEHRREYRKYEAEWRRYKNRHDGGPVPMSLGGIVRASVGRFIRRRHGALPGRDTGKDYVPVLARGGEWFIRNEAVDHWRRKFGDNFMRAINSPWSQMGRNISDALAGASAPIRMAEGGAVPPASGMDLRDMGSLNLSSGGRGGRVFGKTDVLRWIREGVMSEQRRGM